MELRNRSAASVLSSLQPSLSACRVMRTVSWRFSRSLWLTTGVAQSVDALFRRLIGIVEFMKVGCWVEATVFFFRSASNFRAAVNLSSDQPSKSDLLVKTASSYLSSNAPLFCVPFWDCSMSILDIMNASRGVSVDYEMCDWEMLKSDKLDVPGSQKAVQARREGFADFI